MRLVETPLLQIACEESGPAGGAPLLLLHGWPDDARGYDRVLPALHAAGFRTFAPFLRGFGATRFRSPQTPRSGQMAAMAQDAIDLADALGLPRFSVVGHDWGARISYVLAAAFPDRVERCATMAVGWQPGPLPTPSLEGARAFWYQWFFATARGAEALGRDGRAFARFLWDTWSPPGWIDEAAFAATAASFDNPDWAAITVHAYRVRWEEAAPDPAYAALEERYRRVTRIGVPTLLLQGGDDRCVLPASTEGRERYFTGGYARNVLDGVGHFPLREAPDAVAALLVPFLRGEARR